MTPDRFQSRTENYLINHPQLLGLFVLAVGNIPRVTIKGEEILHDANEHLTKGNLIITPFPHTSHWDTVLWKQRVIDRYLNGNVHVVTSARFLDQETLDNLGLGIQPLPPLDRAGSAGYGTNQGIDYIHVVQPRLLAELKDKNSKHYDPDAYHEAMAFNLQQDGKLQKVLHKDSGQIVLEYLEGTRNTSGSVYRAEMGIVRQIRNAPTVKVMPAALVNAAGMQSHISSGIKGIRPFRTVTAVVSPLLTYAEVSNLRRVYSWSPEANFPTITTADVIAIQALATVNLPPWGAENGNEPHGPYVQTNIIKNRHGA